MSDHETTFNELLELNQELGQAESDADAAWFEKVLHERFTMRRPAGQFSTKEDFISGLARGAHRETIMLDLEVLPANRAVARCTVRKWSADQPDAVQLLDNLRVFIFEDNRWQLITWLAEPLCSEKDSADR